jgi:hypothetical protein
MIVRIADSDLVAAFIVPIDEYGSPLDRIIAIGENGRLQELQLDSPDS